MPVFGILLAAGRGSRFGGEKLRAPLPEPTLGVPPGTALGVAAARSLVAALPDSVAVVRPGDTALSGLLAQAGLRILECPRADEGMGASLACGVRATKGADGWVVALGDMPWIAPATIAAIVAALRAGAGLVAPVYRGVRGHPVGFAHRYHPDLAALSGDEGARAVLKRNAAALMLIDVDDPGVVRDVDVPQALAPVR